MQSPMAINPKKSSPMAINPKKSPMGIRYEQRSEVLEPPIIPQKFEATYHTKDSSLGIESSHLPQAVEEMTPSEDNDLPIPRSTAQFPLPESIEGLPIPKALGEPTDGVSEAPVPLPLDQLMELAQIATAQKLPVPQPIKQLTNKS